jgi:CHAT domain-containing protein
LLWRGKYPEVLLLLDSEPTRPAEKTSIIRLLTLEAAANARGADYSKADQELKEADQLCAAPDEGCGDVLRAHGVLANQRGDKKSARSFFQQSLSSAQSHGDRLLEATALLNLGAVSLQEHPDEAIDWSEAAYRVSASLDALDLMQTALGNLGWAYYKLGDSERALKVFLEAQQRAAQLGDVIDELTWARGAGRIYADLHNSQEAARSYRKALDLAEKSNARDDVYGALLAMAWFALQSGSIDDATQHADHALQIAKDSSAKAKDKRVDELYAMLVLGQIAERRSDSAKAETLFTSIENDEACPLPLQWEAQHSLARLYENQQQPEAANRQYRSALATFETDRATVRHEDFQISFLTNAAHIYEDYVHFLAAQGKTDEALRWADNSRARTLLEGLGVPSNDAATAKKGPQFEPPMLQAKAIAAHAKAVILYYWLGEKQSYLWAITPREIKLFTLPANSEIEARAQRYRQALTGPTDVLESFNDDGRWLYRTLVAPAKTLLPKEGRVFIIPDGNLNNLNFETLIVSEPTPHYWIEDAVITDSSSLRLLSASYSGERKHNRRRLLLIGNSIAPNEQYPALPNAQAQMEGVAKHFADAQRQIFSGAEATPLAYLASEPEQFSHIHFVAHGTASRLSPLDSAIVLSRNPAEADSFKLYARDIIRHPLHADIVTISACYSAGERAYSGEGLVGLAWAFLRAGAHTVIAGLWEVTDASTEQMMDRFYQELDKGSAPDAALRAAKLSLLHGSTFHNPFYWAPFQLYAGS